MLERGPEILSSAHRHARQRRVSDIVAWSISRLSDSGKRLLSHLAVFASGWGLAAVEGILAGKDLTVGDAAEALDELLDNSLVSPMPGHRFRMLESIRPVALQHLRSAGEEEEARNLHLRTYAGIYGDIGDWWTGADNAAWLRRIRDDLPNLRLALQWAAKHPCDEQLGERLACAIWRSWSSGGSLEEANRLIRGVIDSHPTPPRNKLRCELLSAVARFENRLGRLNDAYASQLESLEIARELGDGAAEGGGIRVLAEISLQRRDTVQAERLFRESETLSEKAGDFNGVRIALDGIGRTLGQRGDHAEAIKAYEASLKLGFEQAAASGDSARPIPTLNNLGDSYIALGDLGRAKDCLSRALELVRTAGEKLGEGVIMVNLASVAVEAGDLKEARRLLTDALAIRRDIGEPKSVARVEAQLGEISYAEGKLEEAAKWLKSAIVSFDALEESYEAAVARLWAAWVAMSQGDLRGATSTLLVAIDAVINDASTIGNAFTLLTSAGMFIRSKNYEYTSILIEASRTARRSEGVTTPRLEKELEEAIASSMDHVGPVNLQPVLSEREALAKTRAWLEGLQP
jgi:non-specific serine/threonine protein kinase